MEKFNQIQNLLSQLQIGPMNGNNGKKFEDNVVSKMKGEQYEENYNDEKCKNYKRYPREYYLLNHSFSVQQNKKIYLSNKEKSRDSINIETITDFDHYNPLGINLTSDFKKAYINNLVLGKINRNCYLVLKIITPIFIIKSTNFFGEDENGEVIQVSIYGFENYYGISDWDELESKIYSINKYMIILNPFYKLYKSGGDGLRVEYPSETILFDTKNDLNNFISKYSIASKDNFKDLGNLMMKTKSYEKAFYYYEQSRIEMQKKEDKDPLFLAILNTNTSEAFLKYNYLSKALFYAEEAIKQFSFIIKEQGQEKGIESNIQKTRQLLIKSLFRKIRSLVGLRKYKEAYEFIFGNTDYNFEIKEILSSDLYKNQIEPLLIKIKKYWENQLGKYDFCEMIENENLNFYLDNGDYLSPKITLDYDSNKGVKVIAINKIKKGEILIAEKALSCTNNKRNLLNQVFKLENERKNPFELIYVLNQLSEKLIKCPLDYEGFFLLYDGNNLKENIKQRKELITSIDKDNSKISREKINRAINCNQFGIHRDFFHRIDVSAGLWVNPSFINHNCLSNTTYIGIGDFYLCFATKDINEKEEITTRYTSIIEDTFESRSNFIKEAWKFDCNCELCKFEKNKLYIKKDPIKKKYESLIHNLHNLIKSQEKMLEINFDIFKVIAETEEFLDDNKKNLSSFEKAKAYYFLLIFSEILRNYDVSKKYYDLVFKYCKDNDFMILLETYDAFAIELEGNNNNYELEKLNENFIKILVEYTPFKENEIKKIIEIDTAYYNKKKEEEKTFSENEINLKV